MQSQFALRGHIPLLSCTPGAVRLVQAKTRAARARLGVGVQLELEFRPRLEEEGEPVVVRLAAPERVLEVQQQPRARRLRPGQLVDALNVRVPAPLRWRAWERCLPVAPHKKRPEGTLHVQTK